MHLLISAIALAHIAAGASTPQDILWFQAFQQAQKADEGGRYQEALQLTRKAAAIADHFEKSDARTWKTYNMLAIVSEQAGFPSESVRMYHRTLTMLQAAIGKENTDYARVTANFGTLQLGHGELAAADHLLHEALSVEGRLENPDRTEMAIMQVRLADVLLQRHHLYEAEQLLDKASPLLESSGQVMDASMAISLRGLIRREQKRYDESIDLLRRGVEVLEEKVGTTHPILLRQLNYLAAGYELANRNAEAEATYRRAEAICEKTLPAEHPTRAALLSFHAAFLRRIGEKSQAKAMEAEARSLLRDTARREGLGATVDVSSFRQN